MLFAFSRPVVRVRRLNFIPYTQHFLDELDEAIGLWLSNLYRKHPQLKNSTHYWSVSWLPESQRKVTRK